LLNLSDLLGKKFAPGASGEDDKYNCYHLVVEVLKRVGRIIPKWPLDGKESVEDLHELIQANKLFYTDKIPKPEPYALVIFSLLPPYSTHMGVVLGDSRRFIHILSVKRGVAIERLDSPLWERRIEGFYRTKEI